MGLVYWNNKPLWVNGKPAFSLACCCNVCARACIVVRLAFNSVGTFGETEPWEPDLGSGPPAPSSPFLESCLKWHAHSYDLISSSPPRSGYHTHVYLLEVKYNKFATASGVPALFPIQRYEYELEQWVTSVMASNGGDNNWYTGDTAEIIGGGTCLTTFPSEEWARPPLDMGGVVGGDSNWTGSTIYGPITETCYPECTVGYE